MLKGPSKRKNRGEGMRRMNASVSSSSNVRRKLKRNVNRERRRNS